MTKQPPLPSERSMPNVTTPPLIESDDWDDISPYEAAAIQRRKENRELLVTLGLVKVHKLLLQD